MAKIAKYLTISSVILVCLAPFVVESSNAEVLPAPHFTLNIVDDSFTSPYATILNLTQGITTYQIRNLTIAIDNIPQANYYLIEYNTHTYSSQWIPIYSESNVTARVSSGLQTTIIISMRYNPEITYEFRVQSVSGIESNNPLHDYGATDKIVVGDVSSWSTQTIRINPASDITSIVELLIAVSLVAITVVVSLFLILRKRRLTKSTVN